MYFFRFDASKPGHIQEMRLAKAQMIKDSENAQEAIGSLLVEKQEKFYRNIDARMAQIGDIMKPIGPPSEERRKAIADGVKAAEEVNISVQLTEADLDMIS